MTSGSRPESSATQSAVPDRVALDQRFVRGDLYAVRAAVAAHVSALGGAPQDVEDLVIVASELATNAILHGGGGGRLRLWSVDGLLALQVSDDGGGFVDAEHAGQVPQEPAASGGRGLWLARQLCDDVQIHAAPSGTAVTVLLRLSDGHPRPGDGW
jgi:anti-sigma regulatory factor (Ser/Thr protein kinase)